MLKAAVQLHISIMCKTTSASLLCVPKSFYIYCGDYRLFQAKTGKYIPPHARDSFQDQDTKKQEQLKRLRRQMKGLLNRVAENNMNSIALEVGH